MPHDIRDLVAPDPNNGIRGDKLTASLMNEVRSALRNTPTIDEVVSGDALDSHIEDTANPHEVTAAQVGLGNVTNTSDANKPVSTAQQAALDLKADLTDLDGLGGESFVFRGALAGDVSTAANTTPVDLTGLVFTFEANSWYMIDFIGMFQTALTTTGMGLQINVSAAVTQVGMTFYHTLANSGGLSGGASIADDASVGVSSGVPTANTNVPVMGRGLLVSAGTGGTAQLRLRSETSAVGTMKAGAVMSVVKIA